jgi:hypothetical protein
MTQPVSVRSRAPKTGLYALITVMLTLMAVIALLPSHSASASRLAVSQSTLNQYRAWMVEARAKYPYPQSVDKMYRVMMCESGGNANVSSPGGTYKGLFQYHTNTWRGNWNPYRNMSLWDAKTQIFATAKAWSVGMQSHWSCYYITSGR